MLDGLIFDIHILSYVVDNIGKMCSLLWSTEIWAI